MSRRYARTLKGSEPPLDDDRLWGSDELLDNELLDFGLLADDEPFPEEGDFWLEDDDLED